MRVGRVWGSSASSGDGAVRVERAQVRWGVAKAGLLCSSLK